RFAVEIGLVTGLNQRASLRLFTDLPLDELDDLRVVHVEADHLGRAAGGAAALGGSGRAVEDLQEAHEPARGPAAAELLLLSTEGAEVRAGPRPVFEQARFGLHQLVDRHQVVVDALDEASRALRVLVRVLRLADFVELRVPVPVAALALDAVALVEAAVEPDG